MRREIERVPDTVWGRLEAWVAPFFFFFRFHRGGPIVTHFLQLCQYIELGLVEGGEEEVEGNYCLHGPRGRRREEEGEAERVRERSWQGAG